MNATWNPNVMANAPVSVVANFAQDLGQDVATMERRKRGCKFGRRKGRCMSRKQAAARRRRG